MPGRYDIALGRRSPRPDAEIPREAPRDLRYPLTERQIRARLESQGRAIAAEQNENIVREGSLTAEELARFNSMQGTRRGELTPEELARFNAAARPERLRPNLLRTAVSRPLRGRSHIAATVDDAGWYNEYMAEFPATGQGRSNDDDMLMQLQTMILGTIEFALTHRPSFTETLRSQLANYSRDMATFRFCLPRRYGNSRIAHQLMQTHPDALLIVLTEDMAGAARRDGVDRDRILSVRSRGLFGRRAPLVVVDGATYMTREQIDTVYMGARGDFYVLLG